MALERIEQVDAIEVRPLTGNVGVRKVIRTMEDGVELSTNFMTTYFSNGDDLSNEDPLVQLIAETYWNIV
ncbi:MAG: hypothetical protein ACO3CD_04650 [Candidatus Nanopelagicaceae bacterium]